ncbi:hypothetical protein A4A49_64326 [Nicotiana attenuata]|uniref:Zinc finger GRF-type domain-containing protein n=1 Tax=Nicotiana attenuata TaxID=49451 RepID=A0A1J6IUB8_NICAT|nr:hypothetical protein A4A49_64326 [Nicotiana attenuata]
MSENSIASGSSHRCGWRLIANHFVAKTPTNAGRRFYKCLSSCGLWEWRDLKIPPHVAMVISNLNNSLKCVEVEKNYLKKMVADLEEADSQEKVKLKNIVAEMKGIKSTNLVAVSMMED